MSTLAAHSPEVTASARSPLPVPAQRAAQPLASPEPSRSRGRLTLAATVVEKTAAQAAVEVAASRGRSGGFLGIGGGYDATSRPSVDVDLTADYADLEIKVGIGYPGSLRKATEEIRDHVTRRVGELTGVRVRSVDIDVTFVTLETDPDREELR